MDIKALIESYLSATREDNNKFSNEILEIYEGDESSFLKLISSGEVDNSQLFLLISILEEATNKLTFNIQELFECCVHLVERAGDDLASYVPKDIFIDYLVKKPEEFEVIFKQAVEDDSYNGYLDWFLLVGYQINKNDYIEESIDLLKRNDERSLRSVLFALSRVEVSEEKQIDRIFREVEIHLENKSIDIRSYVLRLIVFIPLLPELMQMRVLSIVEKSFENLDEVVIHNAACLLRTDKYIPQYLESKFISAIVEVDLKNEGTLDQIDWWLYKLAKKGDLNKVLSFIQLWNKTREKVLNVVIFKHFSHCFYHSSEKLSLLITSVFLSQDYYLMCSFYRAWDNFFQNQKVVVHKELLLTSVIEKPALYLAKKAYSWLFIHSEKMSSYIFSLLPYVSNEEQEEIGVILRLVALNYPTVFNDFFEKDIEENDKNTWLYTLKEEIDIYFEDLKSLAQINEFRTSKENRIYRDLLFQDQMRKYREESEKNNHFLSLITKQIVLYGRGTISQFKDLPRQESILHTIGSNSYFPLVLFLDPHNHSQLLNQYKEDGCKEVL